MQVCTAVWTVTWSIYPLTVAPVLRARWECCDFLLVCIMQRMIQAWQQNLLCALTLYLRSAKYIRNTCLSFTAAFLKALVFGWSLLKKIRHSLDWVGCWVVSFCASGDLRFFPPSSHAGELLLTRKKAVGYFFCFRISLIHKRVCLSSDSSVYMSYSFGTKSDIP